VRLWPPGAAWHEAHDVLFGCVNAQLAPGFLWQVAHAPGLWFAGASWQLAQLADECLYTAAANGADGEWHDVQSVP